jgi:hypothetical protein
MMGVLIWATKNVLLLPLLLNKKETDLRRRKKSLPNSPIQHHKAFVFGALRRFTTAPASFDAWQTQ